MLNTLLRFCAGSPSGRTNTYVSSAFQLADHLSSRPSRAGLSGTTRAPVVGASRLGAAGVAGMREILGSRARTPRTRFTPPAPTGRFAPLSTPDVDSGAKVAQS